MGRGRGAWRHYSRGAGPVNRTIARSGCLVYRVPMPGFTVSLDDVTELGAGLVRPECVLCTAGGNVYTSDWRGGIA
jgi:hypothetical protein